MLPNLSSLLLWGLPLLAVAEAIIAFALWLWPTMGGKIPRILRGVLMAAGFLLITYMNQLVAAWPALGVYGPGVIWAVAAFLIFAGFLKIEELMGKTVDIYYNVLYPLTDEDDGE